MTADPARSTPAPPGPEATHAAHLRLGRFLSARLTEELGRIWARDHDGRDPRRRPGVAAQVAAVDEVLTGLAEGRLPPRWELRLLLHAYGGHRDYEPGWTDLLLD